MNKKYQRQGDDMIHHLSHNALTYSQMISYGWSNCPWKRVMECLDQERYELIKAKNQAGLTTWRVRRRTRR